MTNLQIASHTVAGTVSAEALKVFLSQVPDDAVVILDTEDPSNPMLSARWPV